MAGIWPCSGRPGRLGKPAIQISRERGSGRWLAVQRVVHFSLTAPSTAPLGQETRDHLLGECIIGDYELIAADHSVDPPVYSRLTQARARLLGMQPSLRLCPYPPSRFPGLTISGVSPGYVTCMRAWPVACLADVGQLAAASPVLRLPPPAVLGECVQLAAHAQKLDERCSTPSAAPPVEDKLNNGPLVR